MIGASWSCATTRGFEGSRGSRVLVVLGEADEGARGGSNQVFRGRDDDAVIKMRRCRSCVVSEVR